MLKEIDITSGMVKRTKFPPERIERDIGVAVRFLSHWRGVKRIWLFGSAAKGAVLDWRSDLDFAVEGMPAEDQARAWAELDEQLTLPVDLVRWETANAVLRDEVTRWGKLVYEA